MQKMRQGRGTRIITNETKSIRQKMGMGVSLLSRHIQQHTLLEHRTDGALHKDLLGGLSYFGMATLGGRNTVKAFCV